MVLLYLLIVVGRHASLIVIASDSAPLARYSLITPDNGSGLYRTRIVYRHFVRLVSGFAVFFKECRPEQQFKAIGRREKDVFGCGPCTIDD